MRSSPKNKCDILVARCNGGPHLTSKVRFKVLHLIEWPKKKLSNASYFHMASSLTWFKGGTIEWVPPDDQKELLIDSFLFYFKDGRLVLNQYPFSS